MRGKHKLAGRRLLLDWRFDLAVVAVLAGCALLFLPKQAYQLTGDELYDDYARLLIRKYNKEYPSDLWLWVQATILKNPKGISNLSMPEIAGWQNKYGDDPRYW